MTSLNDVLLAMSNVPVDDPIAEIWGRGLQGGGYTVREYTGALPITITANGEALIDYCIYGNTVQDGTPTSENPVDVVGCGVRTENLFDNTDLEEGYIDINTGANLPNVDQKRTRNYITVQANTTYTFSNYNGQCRVYQYSNNSYLGSALSNKSQYSFTTNSNCTKIRISGSKGNFLETTMLNLGSTALPYEPYGYKLPMTVSDGNTVQTVPIYLGEAEATRRIKKLVLTGMEPCNISISTVSPGAYCYSFKYSEIGMTDIIYNNADMWRIPYPQYVCSHFKMKPAPSPTQNDDEFTKIRDGEIGANTARSDRMTYNRYIILCSSEYTTIAGFKSFLATQYAAGTPVTIWYVLAEPETGIVNEPLMKIGNYADTVDSTQTSVQIPTFAGTTTIDYDGTPKPSQMYIKYLR